MYVWVRMCVCVCESQIKMRHNVFVLGMGCGLLLRHGHACFFCVCTSRRKLYRCVLCCVELRRHLCGISPSNIVLFKFASLKLKHAHKECGNVRYPWWGMFIALKRGRGGAFNGDDDDEYVQPWEYIYIYIFTYCSVLLALVIIVARDDGGVRGSTHAKVVGGY